MAKMSIDVSSFSGQVQQVDYGVRTKVKHTCFNYDTGNSKAFYNIKDAVRYCKRFWRGCDWDIHVMIGNESKLVASS